MSSERFGREERKTGEVDIVVEIYLDEPAPPIASNCSFCFDALKEEPNFGSSALSLFEHLFAQIYKHGLMGAVQRGVATSLII